MIPDLPLLFSLARLLPYTLQCAFTKTHDKDNCQIWCDLGDWMLPYCASVSLLDCRCGSV